MTKWYTAKLVSIHYIKFEAQNENIAKIRAKEFMDETYKKFPTNHKREYFVDGVEEAWQ